MKQQDLPLDSSLLAMMATPEPKIGWRRAHCRTSKLGRSVRVSFVVVNSDRGPREKMMLRQLPETVKRPQKNKSEQLEIFKDNAA